MGLYMSLGCRAWAKLKGYGRQWSVEAAYSTFKLAMGESCMARALKDIAGELMTKAFIYNMLIRL